MEITVKTNLAEFPGFIDKEILKQMRFATSVTLYETAKQAQEAVRADLPHEFTIRNNWVSRDISMVPGSSRAIRNSASGISDMKVEVGTVDEFMRRQAEGGVKKPHKADSVAIPIREPKTEITTKRKWPGALMKKPGYFVWRYSDEYDHYGIFYRVRKTRLPIRLVYKMQPSVEVHGDWDLLKVVYKKVLREYNGNFHKAFADALATARIPKKYDDVWEYAEAYHGDW